MKAGGMLMKNLWIFAVVAFCVVVLGCQKYKPPMQALPGVTLVERSPEDGNLLLRFSFQDMDRYDWKNKVLKAQLIQADGKPELGGPGFKDPSPEFCIDLVVGKLPESESCFFVASWGKSTGGVIGESEHIDLPGPDGEPNRVTVSGAANFQISQILRPCTGPNVRIPFDPDRGIDLVRIEPSFQAGDVVGTKPLPRVLRIYAARATPSSAPAPSPAPENP